MKKLTNSFKQLTKSACMICVGLTFTCRAATGTIDTNRVQAGESRGTPKELAHDDGVAAGKRSVAGSGHAVRFDAAGTNSYLTAVRVFGSRYGQPAPPAENASIWLCDAEFKVIATFPMPYSAFTRGEPKWVAIPVTPTKVPSRFIVCVGFNPTATKGVYVHYDAGSSGDSFLGLPGGKASEFKNGDWLIRAVIRETKD